MESGLPLVTIAIPTYNQAHFVREAIESALQQTYTNLEIVIGDDASQDNTQEVCRSYLNDSRVRYFRNAKNLGRVGNYRKLLYEHASGEWYVNLDGDDYFTDKEFIATGIRRIKYFEDKGYEIMFYHSALKALVEGQFQDFIPRISQPVQLMTGKDFFIRFFSLNASSHLTMISNRIQAMAIDYYSKDTLFTDVHSFLRLALHGHVILDQRLSAVWRCHDKNASNGLEDAFTDEMESRRDIADYARPFVGERCAEKWLGEAKDQIINNLIYKNMARDAVNRDDWARYFRYFKFSTFFIKHFFKYILLSFKSNKADAKALGITTKTLN